MRAQAVAHDEVDVVQLQRRRRALFVDPAHARAAQHDLALPQQRVEQDAVTLRRPGVEREAGDPDRAGDVATHLELGTVDQQLLQPQFEREQRARRRCRRDARQPQHLALRVVEQHDVVELERRHPAAGAHAQVTDAHRHAERAARLRLDLRQPRARVGQNTPMQRQPSKQP